MTEKKHPDYTNSAVQLCNPPELKTLLYNLAGLKHQEATLEAELQKTPDYAALVARRNDITAYEHTIRAAIDAQGSYQDIEAGDYAIKQRRLTITYIVSKVKEFLRTYAHAVIEEVVSKRKIEGLRKGGLVSQEDLDRCADTTESFVYIIKVNQGG